MKPSPAEGIDLRPGDMPGPYILITPARDEASYIQRTIDSVVAQTCRPAEWIIVDDGSQDATGVIAETAARRYPWIRVLRAPDRGSRVVGGGVVEAFNAGMSVRHCTAAQFLCKLDADLVLPPEYFERLIQHFTSDPRLGIACGRIYEMVGGNLAMLRHEPEMVFGAAKFYRRECYAEIGPLEPALGWDGIDCYQAMRRGWRTATLADAELSILHLRRMGSSHRTILHGCSRRGHGLHYNRAHPLWVLASAVYRMRDRPYVVGGMCVLAGYAGALLHREPRIPDREFGKFLRAWQLRKLRKAVSDGVTSAVSRGISAILHSVEAK